MNTHADKTQESKNHTVPNVVSQKKNDGASTFQFVDNRPEAIIQRKLQKMANDQFNKPIQKQELEEEELLQGKFKTIQKQEFEEEKLLQGKFEPTRKRDNNTGLPDNLKSGIENLSGYSMDDVKVHRNSDKPAQLQAHAYAQGTDIHLGPGQEKHLPHEAWHVVQQKQGRVKPTMQMKGKVNVNDDASLEKEADVMGAKALSNKVMPVDSKIKISSPVTKELLQQKKSGPDGSGVQERKRFDQQKEVYYKSLANGKKKWRLLQNQLARFSSKQREELITELKIKREDFTQKWQNHYQTKRIAKDKSVESHTKGVMNKEEGPQTDKLPYFNKSHMESNTIEAVANYAEKDEARNGGVGLNNSEILWRQYMDVARKQYFFNANKRTQKKMADLDRLQRSQVSTPSTKQVVHFAYPDNKSWKYQDKIWKSTEEEFKAILGTENVVPTVWLLMDHMDELNGKTIESIETRDKDIIIAQFAIDTGALDLEGEWERNEVKLAAQIEQDWESSKMKLIKED